MALGDGEERLVAAAGSDGFRPYDRYGMVLDGLSWKPLRYDPACGSGSFLLRFAPGRPHGRTSMAGSRSS